MRRLIVPVAALVFVVLVSVGLSACGSKPASSATTSTDAPAAIPLTSAFDQGARAGAGPIDESQVARGEQLFKDKGCSACHAFGKRLSCPDLNGVAMRRTAAWMEHQILHPEVMTKEDPIARGLFAEYSLQMPNQQLTADEAKSVIEFLKHQDHEASEHH